MKQPVNVCQPTDSFQACVSVKRPNISPPSISSLCFSPPVLALLRSSSALSPSLAADAGRPQSLTYHLSLRGSVTAAERTEREGEGRKWSRTKANSENTRGRRKNRSREFNHSDHHSLSDPHPRTLDAVTHPPRMFYYTKSQREKEQTDDGERTWWILQWCIITM